MKRISHKQFKEELLKDPKTLAAYEELKEEYELINQMLNARKKAKLTQASVAHEMKTTVSAVSRLESFVAKAQHSPSISTLKKYAQAVNCMLKIKLVPKKSG